jgi:hypothetical protein
MLSQSKLVAAIGGRDAAVAPDSDKAMARFFDVSLMAEGSRMQGRRRCIRAHCRKVIGWLEAGSSSRPQETLTLVTTVAPSPFSSRPFTSCPCRHVQLSPAPIPGSLRLKHNISCCLSLTQPPYY